MSNNRRDGPQDNTEERAQRDEREMEKSRDREGKKTDILHFLFSFLSLPRLYEYFTGL